MRKMKRFVVVFAAAVMLLMMTAVHPAAAIAYLDIENHCSFDTPVSWKKQVLYAMESSLKEERRQELAKDYQKYDVLYRVQFTSDGGTMLYGSREIRGDYPDTPVKDIDTAFYFQHMKFADDTQTELSLSGSYILLQEEQSRIYLHAEYGDIYQFEFKGNGFDEDDISYVLKSAFFFSNIMETENDPLSASPFAKTAADTTEKTNNSGSGMAGVFILLIVVGVAAIAAGNLYSTRKRNKEREALNKQRYASVSKPAATPQRANYQNQGAEEKNKLPKTPLTREQAADALIHLVTDVNLGKTEAEKRFENILQRCPELEKAFPLDEKERFIRFVCRSESGFSDHANGKDKYYTTVLGGSGYQVERHAIGDLLEYSLRIVDRQAQVYISYMDDWGLLYNYDVIPIPEEVVTAATPDKLVDWLRENADPYEYDIVNGFGFTFDNLESNPGLTNWRHICRNVWKDAAPNAKGVPVTEEIIDDTSYIHLIRHGTDGVWQRYDVLLAARPYGWADAVCWADYMATSDLINISTVTTAAIAGAPETERIDEYKKAKNSIKEMPSLKNEYGVLCVGGISSALKAPVKMAFYNQTKTLAIMTLVKNEELINKYTETAVRRTFGTPDAMKRAKPYTEESNTP